MWPKINCKKNLLFKFLNFLVNWFYYIRFHRFLCKTTDVFQQNKNLSDFPFILKFSKMLCQRKNMFWYHVSYLNVLKVIKGAHFITDYYFCEADMWYHSYDWIFNEKLKMKKRNLSFFVRAGVGSSEMSIFHNLNKSSERTLSDLFKAKLEFNRHSTSEKLIWNKTP